MGNQSIITYQSILELNQLLQEQSLPVKIHLQDACGSQTMRMEVVEIGFTDEMKDTAMEMIKEFFEKKSVTLTFSKDYTSFWS